MYNLIHKKLLGMFSVAQERNIQGKRNIQERVIFRNNFWSLLAGATGDLKCKLSGSDMDFYRLKMAGGKAWTSFVE